MCVCDSLNPMFMSFQATMAHPPSHSDLTASPSPSLLDTPTRVWVWLPTGYWGNQTGSHHYQKSVLDIGQVCMCLKPQLLNDYTYHTHVSLIFLSQNDYCMMIEGTLIHHEVFLKAGEHFTCLPFCVLSTPEIRTPH